MSDTETLTADAPNQDAADWRCRFLIEKFDGDITSDSTPYEVIETDNIAMNGGISCLWQALIGNGTSTAGQALTFFNNANAAIGVGDSTTAVAATQTNLQASTNKLRKAMNATYPQHSDGTVIGATSIVFQSTFATGDANFAWQELGIFNSTTDGTGRMLNRKVESLGTKTSASSWQITATITIA